jgi:hypothetical protein
MPDPSIQVRGVTPAPQRLVVDGYVSTVQPAPSSFSDSLYVIVPEMSTEVPLGPCEWMEGHGTALPAQGAKVVVVFDEREVPVIVWWEGQYAEPEPKPPLVSALPSEPKDGAEVYFQNTGMGEKGIAWHLRFRAASAEHKWEFVGGAPLHAASTGASKAVTGNVWTPISGPSVTVPLAGDYDVRATGTLQCSSINVPVLYLGLSVGGAEPAAERESPGNAAAVSGFRVPLAVEAPMTGLSGGGAITQWYRSNLTETITQLNCHISVTPIRVG